MSSGDQSQPPRAPYALACLGCSRRVRLGGFRSAVTAANLRRTMPSRIATYVHRPKRLPRKRKLAALNVSAIVAAGNRRQPPPVDDQQEAAASSSPAA
jgi:hypothetical protein